MKNTNPNNCATCDHKKHNPDAGHCYMFEKAPTEVCMQHSVRTGFNQTFNRIFALRDNRETS